MTKNQNDLARAQQRLLAHRHELKTEKQPRPIGDITPPRYDDVYQEAMAVMDAEDTQLARRPFQDAPDDKRIKQMKQRSINALDTKDPKVKNAVDMCYAWAKRKRDHMDASIIFVGPPGVGKTHCARAIWWSICQVAVDIDGDEFLGTRTRQPVGLFFMANDLITKMGQTIDSATGITTQARAAALIGPAPLIVIDDVGAEQTIPFVAAVDQLTELHNRFFKVIDHCYTMQISVIITSNLTFPDLATRLGKRSFDRLAAMAPRTEAGSFMVDMFGVSSWRMKESGR